MPKAPAFTVESPFPIAGKTLIPYPTLKRPVVTFPDVAKMKTAKTLKYSDLNQPGTKIISEGLVHYKGKTFLTKEDLKYMPDIVHLVKPRRV